MSPEKHSWSLTTCSSSIWIKNKTCELKPTGCRLKQSNRTSEKALSLTLMTTCCCFNKDGVTSALKLCQLHQWLHPHKLRFCSQIIQVQRKQTCQEELWRKWEQTDRNGDQTDCFIGQDEEEEEEKEVDLEGESWRSRNGEFLWFSTHETTVPFYPCPVLTPGITHFANARIISPETAFNLFFHEESLQLILHFTNLQGKRFVHEWRDVEKHELQGYLGLLILAGMFKSQHGDYGAYGAPACQKCSTQGGTYVWMNS